MIDTSRRSVYSTSDTALAAWLYASGFELQDVDNSEFPAVFHFENSSQKLPQLIHDFQMGEAVGNIAAFFRAYKILLSKVKAGGKRE